MRNILLTFVTLIVTLSFSFQADAKKVEKKSEQNNAITIASCGPWNNQYKDGKLVAKWRDCGTYYDYRFYR